MSKPVGSESVPTRQLELDTRISSAAVDLAALLGERLCQSAQELKELKSE